MEVLITLLSLLSLIGTFLFLIMGFISFVGVDNKDEKIVIFIRKKSQYKKCVVFMCLSFLCLATYLFSVGGMESLSPFLSLSSLVAAIFCCVMGVIHFVKKMDS